MNRFYPGPSRGSRVVAFRDQGIEVLNLAVRIRFQPGFLMEILELAQSITGADPTRSTPLYIFSEIMFDYHTLQIALVKLIQSLKKKLPDQLHAGCRLALITGFRMNPVMGFRNRINS